MEIGYLTGKNEIDKINKDIRFQLYHSKYEKQAFSTIDIYDLHKFMVEPNVDKNVRSIVVGHPHINAKKTLKESLLSNLAILDWDFDKTKLQRDRFVEDSGYDDFYTAFTKLNEALELDKCTFYKDFSASFKGFQRSFTNKSPNSVWVDGKETIKFGIHCMAKVISDIYIKQKDTFTPDENDTTLVYKVVQANMSVYLHHINNLKDKNGVKYRFNFKIYNDAESYIDIALLKPCQPMYTSNGIGLKFNPMSWAIVYKMDDYEKVDSYVLKHKNLGRKKLTDEQRKQLIKENEDWVMLFSEYWVENKNNNYISQKITNYFSKILAHDNTNLWFYGCYQDCNENCRKILHSIIQRTYKGKHRHNMATFSSFEKYISTKKKNLETEFYLGSRMSEINKLLVKWKNKKVIETVIQYDTFDHFGREYDDIIRFNGYLSSIKEKLDNIILSTDDKIFFTGTAGIGKTYYFINHICEGITIGKYKKALWVAPKNSLLDQTAIDIINKFPVYAEKVRKSYRGRYMHSDNYDNGGDELIILSSTPQSINHDDIDVMLVDEPHNLVKFSDNIPSVLPKAKKMIFISATMEEYTILENDFRYVKLIQNGWKKKDLNVMYTKNLNSDIDNLIQGVKTVAIYWNNIKKAKEWRKKYFDSTGIWFDIISSETSRDAKTYDTIEKSEFQSNHIIFTSYLLDGININNKQWDMMVIVETMLESDSDIYQVTERFRKATPELWLMTFERKYYGNNNEIDTSRFLDMKIRYTIEKSFEKQKEFVEQFYRYNDEMIKAKGIIKHFGDKSMLQIDEVKKILYELDYLKKFKIYEKIFLEILGKWFNVKEPVYGCKSKPTILIKDLSLKEFWIKNWVLLVDILSLKNHKLDIEKVYASDLSDDDKYLISSNEKWFIKICKRIEMLLTLGANLSVKDNYKKLILSEGNWTSYYNKMAKAKVKSYDDMNRHLVGGNDNVEYEIADDLLQVIKSSSILKTFNGVHGVTKKPISYKYFTVKDLEELVINEKLYSRYKNGLGYTFYITGKSGYRRSIINELKATSKYYKFIKIDGNNYIKLNV